jgi:hypothetical protein
MCRSVTTHNYVDEFSLFAMVAPRLFYRDGTILRSVVVLHFSFEKA